MAVYSFGYGGKDGVHGHGFETHMTKPGRIGGLPTVARIEAGDRQSLMLTSRGIVYGIGRVNHGINADGSGGSGATMEAVEIRVSGRHRRPLSKDRSGRPRYALC